MAHCGRSRYGHIPGCSSVNAMGSYAEEEVLAYTMVLENSLPADDDDAKVKFTVVD